MATNDDPGPARALAARLLEAVRDDPATLVKSFHAELFGAAPRLVAQFPSGLGEHRSGFVEIIEHALGSFADGADPPALIDLLGQLGRDHRKYRLDAQDYQLAQTALATALTRTARDCSASEFAGRAASIICQVMGQGADREDSPDVRDAEVVERIDRPGPTIFVRLRAGRPIPFATSQYLAVSVPQRPGQWRYFSPATPPNGDGELEFHIRATPGGLVSGAVLRHTEPGDRWLLGASYGSLGAGVERISSDQAVLMVAGDTGLAPLRALALALALRGENPRVTLLVGARKRSEFYDLPNLRDLARTSAWFNVLPVLDPAPWAALAQRSVEFAARSALTLISGSPDLVRTCKEALRAGGVPLAKVRHDPIA